MIDHPNSNETRRWPTRFSRAVSFTISTWITKGGMRRIFPKARLSRSKTPAAWALLV
jgi:hypothetical protein